MNPISVELKRLMDAKGMAVEDLWIAAGLTGPSSIYRYLKGERGHGFNSQSARNIERIAPVLGVEPDHFLEYRAWMVRERIKSHPELAEDVYDLFMAYAEHEDQSKRRSKGK